jgi:putative serine protease PepD
MAGGLAGGVFAEQTQNTATTGSASGQPVSNGSSDTTVGQVAEQVSPSVVQVDAATYQGQSTGSGVILSADGKILTNAHVVSGAEDGGEIQITFNDGSTARATVLGSDSSSDLAVLQAENVSGLTPATLGDSSDVQVGDEVIAIGSPRGLQGTVTSGIVSALNREVTTSSEEQTPDPFGRMSMQEQETTSYKAIQTDASLNPGNSGGPLLNTNGEVIGINSAILSPASVTGDSGSVGLGFAIPIDQAKTIIAQLEDGGA